MLFRARYPKFCTLWGCLLTPHPWPTPSATSASQSGQLKIPTFRVAVGMEIAPHLPHRSVQAGLLQQGIPPATFDALTKDAQQLGCCKERRDSRSHMPVCPDALCVPSMIYTAIYEDANSGTGGRSGRKTGTRGSGPDPAAVGVHPERGPQGSLGD